MKNSSLSFSLFIAALLLTSCVEENVKEVEFTVQANGKIFERTVQRGLVSNGKTTNDAMNDFKHLLKKYEPPITSPTSDKDCKGKIILTRQLLLRGGQLETLEEAIYPKGFNTKCFMEIISNGYIFAPVNTNKFEIETNGELISNPDKKSECLLIRWSTNKTTLWFKQKRRKASGIDLTEFYEKHLNSTKNEK